MNNIKIYLLALTIFLIIDAIWLLFIAKDLYAKEIGFLLAEKPNLVAALIFYLIFILGMVFFVINPGIEKESIKYIVTASLLFGLVTYATYDLTNLATVKNFPLKIVVIDMIWGSFISFVVSISTYLIIK